MDIVVVTKKNKDDIQQVVKGLLKEEEYGQVVTDTNVCDLDDITIPVCRVNKVFEFLLGMDELEDKNTIFVLWQSDNIKLATDWVNKYGESK